ncbi:C6 zinc finger domain containing protein [Colletotrichum graminicola]|nr:C6 zinc finger domain containing protein [Colletotrichum graminicola]
MSFNNNGLKHLLPRPLPSNTDGPPIDGESGEPKGPKRRRPYVSRACDSCQEKKNACDGRLTCSQCLRRGITCKYRLMSDRIWKKVPVGTQLVDKEEADSNAEAADLISMLKSVSDGEAFEALQLLRNGSDPAELTSALRGCGIALSWNSLDGANLPPEQSSLEFELMMTHPIAYPIRSLIQPSSMDSELLSQVHENHPQPYPSPFGVRQQLGCMGTGASRISGVSPPSKPFNKRFLSVDSSKWANVTMINELTFKVLSLYFEINHPLMPLFDVDFFLEGLLGNNPLCSCLLINALVSWACLKYATVKTEAATVGCAFY